MRKKSEIERGFRKDEFFGWRAADGMADNYIQLCESAVADDLIFDNFKSRPEFKTIMEHVPRDLGKAYLDDIHRTNPSILREASLFISANDSIGSPRKESYEEYDIEGMSPTTARYMKVLSDLVTLYGTLDNLNIVEIGGGYGGLALVISKKYNFRNYYNIDLKEMAKLSKKYCLVSGLNNFHSVYPDQLDKLDNVKIDLLISNYAYSECNHETQDIYNDKILSRSGRGYITHNTSEERQQRTVSVIKNYDNFRVFGKDFCRKGHPIYVWG